VSDKLFDVLAELDETQADGTLELGQDVNITALGGRVMGHGPEQADAAHPKLGLEERQFRSQCVNDSITCHVNPLPGLLTKPVATFIIKLHRNRCGASSDALHFAPLALRQAHGLEQALPEAGRVETAQIQL